MDENQYKKQLADAGVELDGTDSEEQKDEEQEEKSESESTEEAAESEDESSESDKEDDEESEEESDSTNDSEDGKGKKKSIYKDYKEKKQLLKSETEKREQAERERDEFKSKLEKFEQAGTKEEKQEAKDEIEAFAKEINASPDALRKMKDLFFKDFKPTSDISKEDMDAFKSWRAQNSVEIAKQAFNKDFEQATPSLRTFLPNAKESDLSEVKTELMKLSQKDEWKGKDLEFIAFKNRKELGALVSPKKRGMESKGRKEEGQMSDDFDPNPDFSQMTTKQMAKWEEQYRAAANVEGLVRDSAGKKIII